MGNGAEDTRLAQIGGRDPANTTAIGASTPHHRRPDCHRRIIAERRAIKGAVKENKQRITPHTQVLIYSSRELAAEGYSGCEVRVTHARTEIIIRATHTQDVLGDKGRRIRELKALVEKRFKFPENSLELYAEKVQFRGLSAAAQAESLRYKLLGGLAMRRYVCSPLLG